jgi:hypothetical protein
MVLQNKRGLCVPQHARVDAYQQVVGFSHDCSSFSELHAFLDKASIQGLDSTNFLSTALAIMIRLFHGIDDQGNPAKREKDGS